MHSICNLCWIQWILRENLRSTQQPWSMAVVTLSGPCTMAVVTLRCFRTAFISYPSSSLLVPTRKSPSSTLKILFLPNHPFLWESVFCKCERLSRVQKMSVFSYDTIKPLYRIISAWLYRNVSWWASLNWVSVKTHNGWHISSHCPANFPMLHIPLKQTLQVSMWTLLSR